MHLHSSNWCGIQFNIYTTLPFIIIIIIIVVVVVVVLLFLFWKYKSRFKRYHAVCESVCLFERLDESS
jgi:flagellar basal body-associated protein FliL